jgi:hypothetical protein
MQPGQCQIGSSGRGGGRLSGPAEDVADNGPARRQGLFDLAEHPISVKPVEGYSRLMGWMRSAPLRPLTAYPLQQR